MKMTDKTAKVLLRLLDGEIINASSAKGALIDELILEKILWQKGRHHKILQLIDTDSLRTYLFNQYQIRDLQKYLSATSRADYTKAGTDSKNSSERAFKGFLVNCYTPIKAKLNGEEFTINPATGSFLFISDFETFSVDEDIIIVGVENSMNFRQIREQAYLFRDINPLFASRYPQNQSRDFIKWLKLIPNRYLHFGDFDIAGIGIYLNEYKKYLGERATFFIPENIESSIKENGNRDRYDNQKINFDVTLIKEDEIVRLVDIINREKKGLDQEFLIS